MKIWQILMVSAAAGVALPALAQMVEGPATRAEVEASVKERLGKFDANKDGIVTRDEIMAFTKARMEARADDTFAAMDTDKNGSISRAEYDAYNAKRGERLNVHIEHVGGPGGMISPPPHPEGMTPPPPPGADGKPMIRERTRMMFMGGPEGMVMADGDGKGIVIADAVISQVPQYLRSWDDLAALARASCAK